MKTFNCYCHGPLMIYKSGRQHGLQRHKNKTIERNILKFSGFFGGFWFELKVIESHARGFSN